MEQGELGEAISVYELDGEVRIDGTIGRCQKLDRNIWMQMLPC